jgi:hypothetical protein
MGCGYGLACIALLRPIVADGGLALGCIAALVTFDLRRRLNARPYVVACLAYNATAIVWIALGRPV